MKMNSEHPCSLYYTAFRRVDPDVVGAYQKVRFLKTEPEGKLVDVNPHDPSDRVHVPVMERRPHILCGRWKVMFYLPKLKTTVNVGTSYFKDLDEAAKAYDNAAYYTREYQRPDKLLPLNFDHEYDGVSQPIPPKSPTTLKLLAQIDKLQASGGTLRPAYLKAAESALKLLNRCDFSSAGSSAVQAFNQAIHSLQQVLKEKSSVPKP